MKIGNKRRRTAIAINNSIAEELLHEAISEKHRA
jgi:hypothetical protein